MQDRVAAVGEDDGHDVERLARLRPERLHGVHGAAVGLQAITLRSGAGERGADRQRQAQPDRAAGQLQEVVRRGAVGGGEEVSRRK